MARLLRIAPEVPASDLRGAIEYSTEKLGFTLEAEMPSGDYAVLERDEIGIPLFQADAASSTGAESGGLTTK